MTHVVRQDPTWTLGVCPTAEPLGAGVSTGVLGELYADIQTSGQGPRALCAPSQQPRQDHTGIGSA